MDRPSLLLVALTAATVAGTVSMTWLLAPRPGPVARGAQLVRHLGCEGCHGPGGTGGVPNPGSSEREVPALTGGTWMMYIESEEEIREWILDGRPARMDAPAAGEDALLQMPSYRSLVSRRELDDLIAWYRAASGYAPEIPEPAVTGRRLAHSLGCFGCHGAGGREGTPNPGSFKGYIPGWGSADYDELVRSEFELREWILDGVPARLREQAVPRHFLEEQVVKMPAYEGQVDEEQLDALVAYINWVNETR